jgi:hypothetical protein
MMVGRWAWAIPGKMISHKAKAKMAGLPFESRTLNAERRTFTVAVGHDLEAPA